MASSPRRSLIFSIGILLVVMCVSPGHGFLGAKKKLKSAVFLSPKILLGPGSVANSFRKIDFPSGHIGIKSLDAEIVDEAGNPVPLHETYLHHWLIQPFYVRKGTDVPEREIHRNLGLSGADQPDFMLAKNGGLCDNFLRHFFGIGSETRKTSTHVPDPYAVEIGNPEEIPEGYEVQWQLNTHAIDTREVTDKVGCIECKCDMFNITLDMYGRPINPNYVGGLMCCYDKLQCRVKDGVDIVAKTRAVYMKYIVRWYDWDSSLLPVTIYLLDLTDHWQVSDGEDGEHYCEVEYLVEKCKSNNVSEETCIDIKRKAFALPQDGYIVYAVAHQHAAGRGATLTRQDDGVLICHSVPTYGIGHEAGNEAGYIVGMSTCYPKEMKVKRGELLMMESNYSSTIRHTGVMGIFYLMVAKQLPDEAHNNSWIELVQGYAKTSKISASVAVVAAVCSVAALLLIAAAAVYRRRQNPRDEGYETLRT